MPDAMPGSVSAGCAVVDRSPSSGSARSPPATTTAVAIRRDVERGAAHVEEVLTPRMIAMPSGCIR